jgi:hypothetical protein
VIGIKKKPDTGQKKPDTGQKKTCYTTDNFFGVVRQQDHKNECEIFRKFILFLISHRTTETLHVFRLVFP